MENVCDMCCELVRLMCVQGAADARREGISKENVWLLFFSSSNICWGSFAAKHR